jgi:hypothetical protein
MDIVETLRDFPAVDPYTVKVALDPGAYCFVPDAVREEAAAEIERLREENWQLKRATSSDQERIAAQEAEIVRLRQVEFFAKEVLKRFREAEAQGYHTKDRQYAIDLLSKAIDEQEAQESKP